MSIILNFANCKKNVSEVVRKYQLLLHSEMISSFADKNAINNTIDEFIGNLNSNFNNSFISRTECIRCGECVKICPAKAIKKGLNFRILTSCPARQSDKGVGA
ncbi:4Fe-4S binding protein [Desulfoscipio gibsoniae]|uniref:4Fe-4S binding protein n=1 Tax=Desulfoscipio gibsoniae TaxID=102134 RepID=UPI000232C060|nr:4Fe-4S binding protein [Desulfoscipio gibsoniae]